MFCQNPFVHTQRWYYDSLRELYLSCYQCHTARKFMTVSFQVKRGSQNGISSYWFTIAPEFPVYLDLNAGVNFYSLIRFLALEMAEL